MGVISGLLSPDIVCLLNGIERRKRFYPLCFLSHFNYTRTKQNYVDSVITFAVGGKGHDKG